MNKMTAWRKEFSAGRATDGMRLVDDYSVSIETKIAMSFAIDNALRLARDEERNRCYSEAHAGLMVALDKILTGGKHDDHNQPVRRTGRR